MRRLSVTIFLSLLASLLLVGAAVAFFWQWRLDSRTEAQESRFTELLAAEVVPAATEGVGRLQETLSRWHRRLRVDLQVVDARGRVLAAAGPCGWFVGAGGSGGRSCASAGTGTAGVSGTAFPGTTGTPGTVTPGTAAPGTGAPGTHTSGRVGRRDATASATGGAADGTGAWAQRRLPASGWPRHDWCGAPGGIAG